MLFYCRGDVCAGGFLWTRRAREQWPPFKVNWFRAAATRGGGGGGAAARFVCRTAAAGLLFFDNFFQPRPVVFAAPGFRLPHAVYLRASLLF